MDIKGQIIYVSPVQSGVSKNSGKEWKKQEFVIETFGSIPKKICFTLFGEDKIQEANVRLNQVVNVRFNIDAQMYNQRWFNQINAWKVEDITAQHQQQQSGFQDTRAGNQDPVNPSYGAFQPAQPMKPDESLPF